jgi:DHA2 family multidrug resistance protein-like MFS transporter
LAVIYGVKQVAQDGLGLAPAISIVTGLLIGLLFLRRQAHLADPLIDLHLFRVPSFNMALATNMLGVFIAVGYFLFIAQYMQLVLGLSPLEAGLWSLPSAAGFVFGSNVAPRFIHRYPPAIILGMALAVSAIALGLLTQVTGSSAPVVVATASLIISLALSPVFNLTTELIVGSAPPERAGAASGISETGAELGGALGIAILGSIGTAVYRSELAAHLPGTVPPAAQQVARDTLGAAVGAAMQLPDASGLALLMTARDAFVQALHTAAAIAAVVAIGAALFDVILLRHVSAMAEPALEPDVKVIAATSGTASCCGAAE